MPKKGSGLAREQRVLDLCDGVRKSLLIAQILGENQKYVQRVMLKHDAPRLPRGAVVGQENPAYKFGRRIDCDGYALVTAPIDHPYARKRKDRNYGIILEHRLVLERKIGRYLDPQEVVDHIDGLRLHNDPSNLRLFDSNADHLRATISGQVPHWSKEGFQRLSSTRLQQSESQRVDSYRLRKTSGDARLLEILHALLRLGKDSPYLSGTRLHLKKAGILDLSDSNLIRELALIYQRYE
jgi:hypothetical protein